MSRTNAVKHIHQYYRRQNGIWHCSGIDECTHYVPKNMPEPVGRKSICWGHMCEKPFMLTPYNMREDKPICDACEEGRNALDSIVENIPTIRGTGDRVEALKRLAEKNARAREQQIEEDKPEVFDPTEE